MIESSHQNAEPNRPTETMPHDQPLVSVIIPDRDAERTLARAVTSALNQSSRNFEIIIVDDGSDDDTAGVAKSFDNTVTVIRQPELGISAARNQAIQAPSDH